MKKLILTFWASAALMSAQGQLFSPESWHGAFWGSLIGGIAGANHHCGFSGNGAAIGAGVGFLVGALVGEARRQSYYNTDPYYYTWPGPYAYSCPPYAPRCYSRPAVT